MRRLLIVLFLFAAMPLDALRAQQIEPGETNYYLLSAVLAGGAVVSFAVYRNIASCNNGELDNPPPAVPQRETNCETRDDLKVAMLTVGIGCAVGAIWALARGIRGDRFRPTGVLNLSAGQRGSLRLPDIAYSPPTRDVRVLLVHAAF